MTVTALHPFLGPLYVPTPASRIRTRLAAGILLIVSQDDEIPQLVRHLLPLDFEISVIDDSALFTPMVAAAAQGARQVNPSASLEVAEAAHHAETRRMIRYFDPLKGTTSDHPLKHAVSPTGPIVCLTKNNLLVTKTLRTAVESRKRLILIRSETEFEACLPGATACPKCPVTLLRRTVRARLTSDAGFVASQMFRETPRPGTPIVDRSRLVLSVALSPNPSANLTSTNNKEMCNA